MVTAFRPNAKRAAAAVEIAEGAAAWLQIRLRRDHGAVKAGTKFYGVPSSKADGSFYYTNLRVCSCADYRKRGSGCKHQRAVALHVAQVRRERQEESAEQADPDTQVVEFDEVFDGVEAIKSAFGSDAGAVVQTIRPDRNSAIFPAED